MCLLYALLLNFPLLLCSHSTWIEDINLPSKLLEYTIRNDNKMKELCLADEKCPLSEDILNNGRCWGYEDNCKYDMSYSKEIAMPKCIRNKEKLSSIFFKEADFGYVRKHNEMHSICKSEKETKSSVVCSNNLHYCYVKNIFFHFKNLKAATSKRYREDIIQNGQVGGNCEDFDSTGITKHNYLPGYLRTWFHELQYFSSDDSFVVDKDHCDVIFTRPTIIIKLDAAVNMYHHFCDFINLYASQYINGSFNQYIDIVWWDTHPSGFIDSMFGSTWKAFSSYKPIELISLDGKKVCFKDAMLPLLARQVSGLYYNMPLTNDCYGSGLVHAFSSHIIHRLQIVQYGPILDTVRITILSRSTTHRRIINVIELSAALKKLPNVAVKIVDYNSRIAFLTQLNHTHNSDIFIGIHGAGLTHLLFLPDWAAIFEIYNCGDWRCYYDLARLRGVKYATWPKDKHHLVHRRDAGVHPSTGGAHEKFANYEFDVDEFVRIVSKMITNVRRHPLFVEHQRKLRRKKREEL